MYSTIDEFFLVNRLTHPSKEEWRLTTPLMGEINGLPGSRGWLVATNGILCYVQQLTGTFFLGHLAFFLTDKAEAVELDDETKNVRVRKPKQPSRARLIADLFL